MGGRKEAHGHTEQEGTYSFKDPDPGEASPLFLQSQLSKGHDYSPLVVQKISSAHHIFYLKLGQGLDSEVVKDEGLFLLDQSSTCQWTDRYKAD